MLSFLFALCLCDEKPTQHEIIKEPITISGYHQIIDCLFLTGTSRSFTYNGPGTLEIIRTSFVSIKPGNVDGGAFLIHEKQCQLELNQVCFSDCSASQGGAFYYHPNNADVHPSLSYVSLNTCEAQKRIIFIQGQGDITLTHCNLSDSRSTGSEQIYLICNLVPTLTFSSFEDNEGQESLLFFEFTNTAPDGSLANVSTCNFISNNFDSLIKIKNVECSVSNLIFRINKESQEIFKLEGSASLHMDALYLNNYTGNTSPKLYSFPFYATYVCYAEINFETPEITPYETPYTTPFTTPETTPFTTPYTTPEITPHKTPSITSEIPTPDESSSSEESSEIETSTPSSESSEIETSNDEGAQGGDINPDEDGGSNLIPIIVGVICALIALIAILLLLYIFVFRKKKEEETSSNLSIEGSDELTNVLDESQFDNTNTVDLFSTNVIDNSDPFAADFEEQNFAI